MHQCQSFVSLIGLIIFISVFIVGANALNDEIHVSWTGPHGLSMDTARINFNASLPLPVASTLGVTFRSLDCINCPHNLVFTDQEELQTTTISTYHGWEIRVIEVDSNPQIELSRRTYKFGEYGIYNLTLVKNGQKFESNIIVSSKPWNNLIPLIVAFGVYAILALAAIVAVKLWNKKKISKDSQDSYHSVIINADHENDKTKSKKKRVTSLDAFRGIALFGMIFVNFGGGGYWFFEHANWDGLTFADFLFPWFMFMMGVSSPIALQSQLAKNESKLWISANIIKRAVTLFALGLFLIANGADLPMWRIPGVLQRFGISYLFIGLLQVWCPKIHIDPPTGLDQEALAEGGWSNEEDHIEYELSRSRNGFKIKATRFILKHFKDMYPYLLEYVVALLAVTIWLLITFLLPVPGCPTGYLGPGGLSEGGKYYNCTGGAAGYVDRVVYGYNHIYKKPTCLHNGPGQVPTNYNCVAFDPEGFLGNFTSMFLAFLGMQAGRTILAYGQAYYRYHLGRVLRFVLHGLFWGILAIALCGASLSNGVIPINKNMWSLSYVMVMAATSFIALAICYVFIDWLDWWNGAPFVYLGMNSIFAYIGHGLLQSRFPFTWTAPSGNTHWDALAKNLVGSSIWLIIAYIMYLKKVFITV